MGGVSRWCPSDGGVRRLPDTTAGRRGPPGGGPPRGAPPAPGRGAAQTTVDASGTFRLEVTFVGAPANQPFEVWAGCPATQVKQTFQFTWLG